ncbi:efflux RND transporter permease subunit [Coralloluteibacterium stylophorae]|uniref:Efflux RND transporter permease subunit n=1 Tax=Coralloluteibacterium stylophorae TaxID=1776034 RepID=A0A8J8AX07_9GAMM|nr:efflux RND transporter permease subunit [Coralloluteibacterium stylophorae]MBS7455545.1 efflux RND transporter permease subunit [Coralloluteibacterium stylophorae]
MDIARYSIRHPVNVWLLVLVCLVGGLFAYFNIERLEDPEFTIKEAIVTTIYPGASAEEVETEVSDVLEGAVQQMAQLKEVRTQSMAGYSEMRIEIRDSFRSEDIPQIWDELRRKINDAQGQLPPGAQPSTVNDDFSDVYGIYYALTGDGLTRSELNEVAKDLRRGLITVDGVGQVEIAGAVDEQFVISIPQARLAALRIAPEEIAGAIGDADRELYAGGLRSGDLFLRVSPTGAYDSIEAIRQLPVGRGESRVVLGDIATVSREPVERPNQLIRWDGREAITIGIAGLPSVNIVDVGANVDRALKQFEGRIPLGVELHPIYQQPQVVDEAVSGFALNVGESLAIVIAVLCLVMGWRAGVIIGAILLLTVGGTLLAMYMLGLELERVSLAALIIAMGMLVDNAVVICDGMQVRLRQGMSALRAASESVRLTQWSLLGATIIGILAFAGIGLSQDTTGEFMFSLFMVILISLLLSWVLAVSVVPLFGYRWLVTGDQRREDGDGDGDGEDRDGGAESPYQGRIYDRFRGIVGRSLAHRGLTVGAAALLTVLCVVGFGFLPQSFFPPSSTPMAFIDVETRQGSDIRATSDALARVEDYVRETFPEIQHRVSFVGQGASRFMLTYAPETPEPSYGQIIVLVEEADVLEDILDRFNTEAPERFPDLQLHGERVVFGSNPEARVEARFSGPSYEELRRLSAQAQRIMKADGGLVNVRDDWRQREIVLRPQLDLRRMADAGMSRQDVAQALAMATAGVQVSVLRDGDEQRPLMLRAPDAERADADELPRRLVWSSGAQRYVPLAQVADGVEAVQQEALIHRRDRERTIAVRGEPAVGLQANEAHRRIKEEIEAMQLPPGYSMQWGGEYEESGDAQSALMSTLALPYLGMLLVTVLLFARVRQPVVIWLVVPMAICGVTIGLAVSGQPFGFVALLGLLSLTGLLLKNAIVLVEEIDRQIDEGVPRHTAVVEATTSRLVPVTMAAGTTVLGMVPLLFDALFASMAVTIMGGLAFATVLTLVVVPCLYALFFRVHGDETAEARA